MAILDSFEQGIGFIAARLRHTAALRNAAQNDLVPLMQAHLKYKDLGQIIRVFPNVVGTDDQQLSGAAWTRLRDLEWKCIKAI